MASHRPYRVNNARDHYFGSAEAGRQAAASVHLRLRRRIVDGHSAVRASLFQLNVCVIFRDRRSVMSLVTGAFRNNANRVNYAYSTHSSSSSSANVLIPMEDSRPNRHQGGVSASIVQRKVNRLLHSDNALCRSWLIARPLGSHAASGGASFRHVHRFPVRFPNGDHRRVVFEWGELTSDVRGRGTSYSMDHFGRASVHARLSRRNNLLVANRSQGQSANLGCQNKDLTVRFTAAFRFQRRKYQGLRGIGRFLVPFLHVGVRRRHAKNVHGVHGGFNSTNRFPGRPKVSHARAGLPALNAFPSALRVVGGPACLHDEGVDVSRRSNLLLSRENVPLYFRFFTVIYHASILPGGNIVSERTNLPIPCCHHFALINGASANGVRVHRVHFDRDLLSNEQLYMPGLIQIVFRPTELERVLLRYFLH